MLEKEYDDFIDLLKYFVNMQKPQIKKVNVILYRSGKFKILDSEYRKIDNDSLECLILDFAENDLTNEDLLISALITIAPEEIKMHLPDYVSFSFIETVKKIFNNRVEICSGCPNCMHIRQKES
ncbi:MAG: Sporulation protein YtxC [Clostridia bacterium 41_269]|nr:MAG: Sporulation protein YtxC [Clostridia bacterium 41_269]